VMADAFYIVGLVGIVAGLGLYDYRLGLICGGIVALGIGLILTFGGGNARSSD